MPKTLLLADDSLAIQRVVALTFAGHDVDVVPVGDGNEAVAALHSRRPDIVVADVAMPGKSGYEVAEYMRQSAELSGVPVLLLASAFEPIDTSRVQAVGARGVLTKPFTPAAIVGRVRELLDGGLVAPPIAAVAENRTIQAAAAAPPVEPDVDDYFDQIDRAFAELKGRHPAAPSAPAVPAAPVDPPALPANPAPMSLPDAFSAILIEETGGAPADLAPRSPRAAGAIDIDALVDQVVTRVLTTMSDRLVRETVSEIVSATTERLVREEIDRIKRALE